MEPENRVGRHSGSSNAPERSSGASEPPSLSLTRVEPVATHAPSERMSSPNPHPLLGILAAMVREALEYERLQGREAA